MHTLVLGLGNPILTDDAAGIMVAEAVAAALERAPISGEVAVETASVGGLALMERMLGYTRVIVIDALWRTEHPPGALLRLNLDDLSTPRPTERSVSPHDTSLNVALALGRQLGLPLPEQIIIYAIAVCDILDFSAEPTPAVAAAVPQATAAVLAELAS
jgi:hydrogenase maturation protease